MPFPSQLVRFQEIWLRRASALLLLFWIARFRHRIALTALDIPRVAAVSPMQVVALFLHLLYHSPAGISPFFVLPFQVSSQKDSLSFQELKWPLP